MTQHTTTIPDIKIRVNNQEHSREIQETLFALECCWASSRNKVIYTDKAWIVVDTNKEMWWTDDATQSENKEVTLGWLKERLAEKNSPVQELTIALLPTKQEWDHQRAVAIVNAMQQALDKHTSIPVEWVDELSNLLKGE